MLSPVGGREGAKKRKQCNTLDLRLFTHQALGPLGELADSGSTRSALFSGRRSVSTAGGNFCGWGGGGVEGRLHGKWEMRAFLKWNLIKCNLLSVDITGGSSHLLLTLPLARLHQHTSLPRHGATQNTEEDVDKPTSCAATTVSEHFSLTR